MPLHASRWSARAQKSLFLPLRVSVLFPRFAANSFLPSLSPFFFFRRPPSSFSRSFAARFTDFPCVSESVLVLFTPQISLSFLFFTTFSGVQFRSRRVRVAFSFSKFHFRLPRFLTDGFDVARRSFRSFPRVSLERVTRLQRRAASTTTCRHDNTKSIRSIERSLHS